MRDNGMQRREFITTTAAASLAAGLGTNALGTQASTNATLEATSGDFTLDYAPHFGMFNHHAGNDMIDQIDFMAEAGFRSMEDNGMRGRSLEDQQRISEALQRNGMRLGVFVMNMDGAWRPSLTTGSADERARFVEHARESVEVAKRLNAKHATVVTGFMDRKVPQDIQTGRIIDCMRRAGDIVAPHGLTLVMEPLNTRTNHPGVYMQSIAQGYAVARGANSPGVKILADLYHEQIQSGNLIPTLEACWAEVGYIQFGDNPGRKEPGTGEINYANIVRWLRGRNYGGVIGMEHGNSLAGREGEDQLVAAYRAIDQI